MKKVWAFLLLAYALSWPVSIPLIRLHASEEALIFGVCGPAFAAMWLSRSGESRPDPVRRIKWFVPLVVICWAVLVLHSQWRASFKWPVEIKPWLIFPAMLPAWTISGAFSRDQGVRSLLRTLVYPPNWRWPAVALLSMPVFLLLPAAVVRLFGGALLWPASRGAAWAQIASGAAFFGYSFFFAGVLEEPGWRGFLLERLQERFSPLVASVFVWLPWALWHAPFDFGGWVANSWIFYLQIRVLFLIPIAILYTWIYNRSGHALLAVVLFHAGVNTFPFVLPYAQTMFVLIFVWTGYVVIKERMWRPLPSVRQISPSESFQQTSVAQ
jgi:membrane protease YdiL (CAAX protease family)